MTLRRSEHPATIGALVGAGLFVAYAWGLSEGAKLRACPARLPDGRGLVSVNRSTGTCHYAPPMPQYSPVELRRIAAMRERLEKVGR